MRHALLGILRQQFTMVRRYWFSSVSGMVFGYLVFVLILFSIRTTMGIGMDLGDTTESLIIAYWVVMLTNISYQSIHGYIAGEAATGTLEQLYVSPCPFGWILFGKILGDFLFNLSLNVPFLVLMMATTGRWLHFDVISILPLVVLCCAQAYAFGLVMGGTTLLHKRTGALGQVVTMLLVLFIAAPADQGWWVRFLPLNVLWRCLRIVMTEGVRLWHLPLRELLFVLLQTGVLVGIGSIVFRLCESITKERGLIGQY